MDGLLSDEKVRLKTSDCAARCGLTTRALRVYEKQGLVRPHRDANGWRTYSSQDLADLTTIVTLKKMGLTLVEVRRTLQSDVPTLEETLSRQLRMWRARRDAAATGMRLVSDALHHLKNRRALSAETLCELVRQVELADVTADLGAIARRKLTKAEINTWSRWWESRPNDQAENQLYLQAQNVLLHKIKSCMDRGLAASSGAVSQRILELERSMLEHHVRERACRQLRWNSRLTTKWYRLGQRPGLDELEPDAATRKLYSPRFAGYLESAYWTSPLGRELKSLLDLVARIRKSGEPASARKLAHRFRGLCARWELGNPKIHARFSEFIEKVNRKGARASGRELDWRAIHRSLDAPPNRRLRP